jgi:hypothetical protein
MQRESSRTPEPRSTIDDDAHDVRYWPKADICSCTAHVRFWGKAHMIATVPSGSQESERRTDHSYCAFASLDSRR